jgi:hypothetical protein
VDGSAAVRVEGRVGTVTDKAEKADKTNRAGKPAGAYRLADTRLDGTLDHWPPEPPRPPKTAVDAVRLTLIDTPGQIHRLAWKLSDVGRANQLAAAFRRSKPAAISPGATGRFDARAFFDPTERRWRIAARYLPADNQ